MSNCSFLIYVINNLLIYCGHVFFMLWKSDLKQIGALIPGKPLKVTD